MSKDAEVPIPYDLGVKNAADLLGACTDYVYKHRNDPGWPHYISIGRKIRFNKAAFIAWMNKPASTPE